MDKKTHIDGTTISTVLLPVYVSGGPYETCLFFEGLEALRFSEVVDRYSTADEAMAGHDKWVADIKSGKVSWRNFRD